MNRLGITPHALAPQDSDYGAGNPDGELTEAPIVHHYQYYLLKRGMDIVFAAYGLIIFAPIFLVIALIVKLSSPGPVFYHWNVIGRNGRPFRGYKFRTMVVNADALKVNLIKENEMTGPVFKMKDDPRITGVGRFLRKFSLDELPQLWSILKGDMSLVGPRPAGPHEWVRYKPWQRRKLSVTPGLSCLWQINGRNSINNFDEWVRLDLEYIDNWTIWLDLKIIWQTIFVVIRGTGV